jgi:hypothetical protein
MMIQSGIFNIHDVQLIIIFVSLTKIKDIVGNLDELCFQCSCASMFTEGRRLGHMFLTIPFNMFSSSKFPTISFIFVNETNIIINCTSWILNIWSLVPKRIQIKLVRVASSAHSFNLMFLTIPFNMFYYIALKYGNVLLETLDTFGVNVFMKVLNKFW